jgi:hypothetical protein
VEYYLSPYIQTFIWILKTEYELVEKKLAQGYSCPGSGTLDREVTSSSRQRTVFTLTTTFCAVRSLLSVSTADYAKFP